MVFDFYFDGVTVKTGNTRTPDSSREIFAEAQKKQSYVNKHILLSKGSNLLQL